MAFDVVGAKAEGYSDEEIAQHLAQQNKFDYFGAKKEGYSDSEIIDQLIQPTRPTVDRTLGNTAGAAVGGIGGAALGRSLQAGIREEYPQLFRGTPKPAAPPTTSGIPNITVTGAPEAPALHGGEKWAQKLTGVEVPGAQMNKASLDTARTMAETVGRGGELAGGTIKGGIMVGPQTAAERISGQAAEEVAKKASMLDRAKAAAKSIASSDTLKSANRNVGHVMHGMTNPWAIKTLGNALAGAGAGMQAADAYQRFQDPNQGFIRGAISGLGALGSGAAMTRIPAAMPIGMVVGTAAPFINEYLDEWAKKHPEAAKRLHLADGGTASNDALMRMIKATKTPRVTNMQSQPGRYLTAQQPNVQFVPREYLGDPGVNAMYQPSTNTVSMERRPGGLSSQDLGSLAHEFQHHKDTIAPQNPMNVRPEDESLLRGIQGGLNRYTGQILDSNRMPVDAQARGALTQQEGIKEVLPQLAGYEASLPAGMNLMQSGLGRTLTPQQKAMVLRRMNPLPKGVDAMVGGYAKGGPVPPHIEHMQKFKK